MIFYQQPLSAISRTGICANYPADVQMNFNYEIHIVPTHIPIAAPTVSE